MARNLKILPGDSGGSSPPTYYRGGPNARVDVESVEDIQKWSGVLDITKAELLEAIEKYGPVVRDIRIGLLKERSDEAA